MTLSKYSVLRPTEIENDKTADAADVLDNFQQIATILNPVIDNVQDLILIFKPSGTGDQKTALQAMLDEAEVLAKAEGQNDTQGQVKVTVSIGSEYVRCDSGIKFNPTWVRLVGTGGTLFFGNAPANTICVDMDGNNDPQRGSQASLADLKIEGQFGNEIIQGRVGLRIASSELGVQNVNIRDFETGITFGSNSYLHCFSNMQITRCQTGVLFPSGINNSGENIRFFGLKISDCNTAVDINTSNIMMMSFYSCSFDYIGKFRLGGTVGNTNLPGTASCTGTTVTGIGTDFTSRFAPNDKIFFTGGAQRTISTVVSDTEMTVTSSLSQAATTYRKAGVFRIFKLSTTGNNAVINCMGCHFENWDYEDPPFTLNSRFTLNIFGGKFLCTKTPFADPWLDCSSLFVLTNANQSFLNIYGLEFENIKISSTESEDVLCAGEGACHMFNPTLKGNLPALLSNTANSPNLGAPVNGTLIPNQLQIGKNDAFSSLGRPRLKTESFTGQTADLVQHFVNAVKLSWITAAGKIFGFGLDAGSQTITSVANASNSTDALPKGQADTLYTPQLKPYNTYSTDTTLTTANYFVQANSGVTALTFYPATGNQGRILITKNASGGAVNLTPAGSETIGGSAPFAQTDGTVKQWVSDGANWVLFGSA